MTRVGSAAELRSHILKARRLAYDDVERERAAAAVKAWLLDQIQNRGSARAAHTEKTVPDQPLAPQRLAP
jgi:hypothetical protein